MSPGHAAFLDPTATASMLVWHRRPSLPLGTGFKSSEEVLSTSQTCSSLTSSKKLSCPALPALLPPALPERNRHDSNSCCYLLLTLHQALSWTLYMFISISLSNFTKEVIFMPILQIGKTQPSCPPVNQNPYLPVCTLHSLLLCSSARC